jgi:hypothetical protein
MSNARPSARAVLTLIVTAAAALIATWSPRASSACPVAPPLPLRQLYKRSDLVGVARVGDSVGVARVGDSVVVARVDNGALVRTTLHFSKLLKGENKERSVDLYRVWWRGEWEVSTGDYARDTTLLVFLKKRDAGEGYSPISYAEGVKNLPKDQLKVYVRRLEELAPIMQRGKPDDAEITEWLVRCAEEPATRWEGAYELALNVELPEFADADGGDENAEAPAEADGESTEGESDSASGAAPGEAGANAQAAPEITALPDAEPEESDPDFASLLTTAQKERLAVAFFNADELGEGDYELMRLIATWGDTRLAPSLLKQLSRMADKPPYEAELMMQLVARALDDPTLAKFVARYCADASYQDIYSFGEDEGANDDAESRKEAEAQRAAAAEARFQRSSRLQQFLVLAQQPQKLITRPNQP